jgi:hypothetical protein
MLHFDKAPIHNTKDVQDHLANFGFGRMEHPPYSPDPAPCDFFLFGAMKENFQDNTLRVLKSYSSPWKHF